MLSISMYSQYSLNCLGYEYNTASHIMTNASNIDSTCKTVLHITWWGRLEHPRVGSNLPRNITKSYFWGYFTRKTCVNNACSTSEGRGQVVSENIISVAIWRLVWHWGALSQSKRVPSNPSLPYLRDVTSSVTTRVNSSNVYTSTNPAFSSIYVLPFHLGIFRYRDVVLIERTHETNEERS